MAWTYLGGVYGFKYPPMNFFIAKKPKLLSQSNTFNATPQSKAPFQPFLAGQILIAPSRGGHRRQSCGFGVATPRFSDSPLGDLGLHEILLYPIMHRDMRREHFPKW